MYHRIKIFSLVLISLFFVFSVSSYAQEGGWVIPKITLSQAYESNIFLDTIDTKSDWITTVSPALTIKPELSTHELTIGYEGAYNYFHRHNEEDNKSHTNNVNLKLNFNKFRIDLNNRFRHFSDRSGGEDVNRIPRTQDAVNARSIFEFNKLDLTFGYLYQYENYRSQRGIGNFNGEPLSYDDLDRNEQSAEIETAFKLWPKTALLFSTAYGIIEHRTGKKSDSNYIDLLTGIRGEPSAKMTAEFKLGFRNQRYEDDITDFQSLLAFGSIIEKLTYRDILRFDFLRTSYDTIYQSNAYYEVSFFGAQYEHGFTDRFSGNLALAYQLDTYPVETTEGSETKYRKDGILKPACSLKYKTPKGLFAELKHEFMVRDSNFSEFDYRDNISTLSLGIEF